MSCKQCTHREHLFTAPELLPMLDFQHQPLMPETDNTPHVWGPSTLHPVKFSFHPKRHWNGRVWNSKNSQTGW